MIIALFALAFAMIFGGFLTIFYGWEIVLIERGWTMVLAGSISAASGALLLGIAAAVARLELIQRELAHLQNASDGEVLAGAQAMTGLSLAALSGGLLGRRKSGKGDDQQQDVELETLPALDDLDRPEKDREVEVSSDHPEAPRSAESVVPFKPRTSFEAASVADDEISEAKVPDFLLADRFRGRDAETRISDVDASLYDGEPAEDLSEDHPQEKADHDGVVAPAAWPEASPEPAETEAETEAEPEPEAEPAVEEPEQRSATVIGTYNSGDNSYVMFSDGSIEAQTPKGVFRFKSLEELKEFIASGGESSNSSAAI